MEHRPISPAEALPRITRTLTEGRVCRLVVTGTSMAPFLRDRADSVILAPLEGAPKRGDILFYRRPGNVCVLHRVHKVRPDGILIMCGDAQTWLEPIHPAQIVGRVTRVERGGKAIDCGALSWRLASAAWQALLPVRPRAMALLRRAGAISSPDGTKTE